jgi:hypothetical protein
MSGTKVPKQVSWNIRRLMLWAALLFSGSLALAKFRGAAMTDYKSSSSDLLAARLTNLDSANTRNSGVDSKDAMDQRADNPTDENLPKPFKSKCILIEPPPGETLHIGYVGGVRMPKKQ